MSRVCDVCGRGKMAGNKVSHSDRKSSRTFEINLQQTEINGEKVKACTKCIKKNKKA